MPTPSAELVQKYDDLKNKFLSRLYNLKLMERIHESTELPRKDEVFPKALSEYVGWLKARPELREVEDIIS